MAVVGRSGYSALVLVLLLLLPGVGAYSIEEAHLQWYEHEVRTIAPNVDLPGVVATLRLSADFQRCWDERPLPVCALILDTDGLAALDNQRLEIRDRCRAVNGSIQCTTPAATLRVTNGSARIGYVGQAGTERGIRGEVALPLTLDTTAPSVASITTGVCLGENGSTCYIAANVPSPVTVTFTDTQTAFDWRLVFLGRDGATGTRARECSGTTCVVDLITPCTDGQEFRLGLTRAGAVSSREDAQNTVAPYAGTRVVCKTDGPKILSFNITANGIAGQAVSGGTLSATARVAGGIGDVTAAVETGGALGGNATNQTVPGACDAPGADGVRTCAWELGPLADGTFTLAFTATDALGLYSKREQKVTVLRLVTVPANTTIDFFTIRPGALEPERLNRHALEVAAANFLPYPSYLPYQIQRTGASASILNQELTRCHYRTANATNWTSEYTIFALGSVSGSHRPESRVLYPDADWNVSNRLDLQVRADRQTLGMADEFQVRCELAMTVRDGNTIYSAPEIDNITFTLRLRDSALGQPGARVARKIEKAQDDIDSGWMKQVNKLEQKRQELDKICQGAEDVVQVSNALADIQVLAAGFCATGVGSPIGEPIANAISVIQRPIECILNPLWNGYFSCGGPDADGEVATRATTNLFLQVTTPAQLQQLRTLVEGGPLRIACRQINCRQTAELQGDQGTLTQIRTKLSKQAAEGSDGTAATGASTRSGEVRQAIEQEVFDGANVYDPERSLTGAIMNMCLGGVIYNLQKHVAIECGYVQCLKEQTAQSQNVAVCERKRAFEQCVEVVGVVEQLPVVNWFNNVLSNVNHILQNLPAYAVKTGVDMTCMRYQGPTSIQGDACFDWVDVGCSFADSVLEVVDAGKQTTQARQGLRDPDAARARVQLCKAAADKKYTAVQGNRMTGDVSDESLRYAAFIRNEQARTIVADDTTGINGAIVQYMQYSDGRAPTGNELLVGTPGWMPINDGKKTAGHYYVSVQGDKRTVYFSSSNKMPKETPKDKPFGYNIFNTDRITIDLPDYMTEAWMRQDSGVPDPADPARQLTNAELVEARALEGTGIPATQDAWQEHVIRRQDLITAYQELQQISHNQNAEARTALERGNWEGAAQALGLACDGAACEAAVRERYDCSDSADCAAEATERTIVDASLQRRINENTARVTQLQQTLNTMNKNIDTVSLQLIKLENQNTALRNEMSEYERYLRNPPEGWFSVICTPTPCRTIATVDIGGNVFYAEVEGTDVERLHDLLETQMETSMQTRQRDIQNQIEETEEDLKNLADRRAELEQEQNGLRADNTLLQTSVPLTPQQVLQAAEGERQLILRQMDLSPEEQQAFEAAAARLVAAQRAYDSCSPSDHACLERNSLTQAIQEYYDTAFCDDDSLCESYLTNYYRSEPFKRAIIKQNSQQLGGLLGQLATTVFGKEIQRAVESISTRQLLGNVGFLDQLDKYADPRKRELSICGQINEIEDNDDGAIYVPAAGGLTQVTGTFGAEVRPYLNGSRSEYIYMVVAYLNNPRGNPDNAASIWLTDKKSCGASACPDEVDLTNGAKINLSAGGSFSSGTGLAKTRIIYLPGEYGRLCVRFDREFPDGSGKREYCRTVEEDIFDADAPTPPAPQATGAAAPAGGNPIGGWV